MGRRIAYSEPGFKAELKKVGEAFVQQMADTPACLTAFDAWHSVFMEEFEELKGVDGGEFELAKELTWELFLEVLYEHKSVRTQTDALDSVPVVRGPFRWSTGMNRSKTSLALLFRNHVSEIFSV